MTTISTLLMASPPVLGKDPIQVDVGVTAGGRGGGAVRGDAQIQRALPTPARSASRRWAYSAASRASRNPYPLVGLDAAPGAGQDPYYFYAVGDKKMKFGKPTPEQQAAGERSDRSIVQYNTWITVSGIPEEAYHYMLGSRSAVEQIIDRYHIKTDKASGIMNNPNDWPKEVGDPRYILICWHALSRWVWRQ